MCVRLLQVLCLLATFPTERKSITADLLARRVHQLFILLPGLALISGELHHSHLEIILAEEELK